MRSIAKRSWQAVVVVVLVVLFAAVAVITVRHTGGNAETAPRWTATWTAAPQQPSAGESPNWSEAGFSDNTIRQTVRISTGGDAVRVRLSNRFGKSPIRVADAAIAAARDEGAIDPESSRPLTVAGSSDFTIPPGAEIASDRVDMAPVDRATLTISMYFDAPTGPATFHAQAMSTAYRSAGNHVADDGAAAYTESSTSWYLLNGVDVVHDGADRGAIVAFGDSITDGYGSTVDANARFTDALTELLAAAGAPRAVVNQGISGNRLAVDSAWLGAKGVARFKRDVLEQPGAGTVVVLEGTNDFGMSELPPTEFAAPQTEVSVTDVVALHRNVIQQARASGLRVVGATLPPFKGSPYYSARSESKRSALNSWIRTAGAYDAVVDVDLALRSPSDPQQLAPAYDSGDHLHPNDAGYRAMAAALQPADLTQVC